MDQAIKDFPKQFLYEPVIENAANFEAKKKFIVCGMGGSALGADILKLVNPYLDIIVHRDYGLPPLSEEELRMRIIIISSYSGNTEEPLDSFETAMRKKLMTIVISTGAKAIEMAKAQNIPYIIIPSTDIQPRSALGFSARSFLKAMGEETMLRQTDELATSLNPLQYEEEGKELANIIKGKMPLVYSSTRNWIIGYNWKIKFNETGKIPAFYNVIPESNHNEINGFGVKKFAEHFYSIFLKDATDHPRIIKRIEITKKLYAERGVESVVKELKGESVWHKIFSSLLIADWAAYYTAKNYGLDSEQVPTVERLKKMLNQ